MAHTEFCCRAGGSNLNAGTRTGTTTEPGTAAAHTYASGNWTQSTRVFTVASGNPQSDGVAVGDFASVYADGSTVTGFVGRVTAVDSTTITVSATASSGTAPTDGTANRTLKIGGAWLGPNGASGFPWGFAAAAMTNAAGHSVRVNFKHDQTYSITAAMTHTLAGLATWQGYASSYGDGARAVIDGGTSGTAYVLLTNSGGRHVTADLIFQNNGGTASAAGVALSVLYQVAFRCVFHDLRGVGLSITSGLALECEAYNCNQNNTTNAGGMVSNTVNAPVHFVRCVSHDNTQFGFFISNNSQPQMYHCISESNTLEGLNVSVSANTVFPIIACEFYNNGRDGLRMASANPTSPGPLIENSNFIKNTGWGINKSGAGDFQGRFYNLGFGTDTQANGSGDTTGATQVESVGAVSYATNAQPWTDPVNGDFRIALNAARNAGRGNFTQVQAGHSGTVGYPDIGAAPYLLVTSGSVGRSNGIATVSGVGSACVNAAGSSAGVAVCFAIAPTPVKGEPMLQVLTGTRLNRLRFAIRKDIVFYAPLTDSLDYHGIEPVTFTRSGASTATWRDGAAHAVGANRPRFEYSGETQLGILLETGEVLSYPPEQKLDDAGIVFWVEQGVVKKSPADANPFNASGALQFTDGLHYRDIVKFKSGRVLTTAEEAAVIEAIK